MSGRTARRARKEGLRLLDRDSVFSAVLSEMMTQYGIDYDKCDRKAVDTTIAICCAEADACWDEFVLWAIHGDDQRAKTMEILAAARRAR